MYIGTFVLSIGSKRLLVSRHDSEIKLRLEYTRRITASPSSCVFGLRADNSKSRNISYFYSVSVHVVAAENGLFYHYIILQQSSLPIGLP